MDKIVGILGCQGGFGQAITALLRSSGIKVIGIDNHADAEVRCDVFSDIGPLVDVLSSVQILMLAVPESVALKTLAGLDGHTSADHLLVDICSVKTPICTAAGTLCLDSQYLSVHPMFAPDRGFADNNLVAIRLRDGNLVQAMVDWLQTTGCALVETDFVTHDEVTRVVQVLTHATLLSFAQAKDNLAVDPDLLEKMATPIFAELSRTASGMLSENPQLYHNIQNANPGAYESREALGDAVSKVLDALGDNSPDRTVNIFKRLR